VADFIPFENPKPTVIIDSREQDCLIFKRLPSARGSLRVGDYSWHGGEHLFAVERKSCQDFIGSIKGGGLEYDSVRRLQRITEGGDSTDGGNRGRLERELDRMKRMEFARFVIVGVSNVEELCDWVASDMSFSKISPKSVAASVRSIDAEFVPVHFFRTPAEAAAQTEEWIWWHTRSLVKTGHLVHVRQKQDERKTTKEGE